MKGLRTSAERRRANKAERQKAKREIKLFLAEADLTVEELDFMEHFVGWDAWLPSELVCA